jgi:hypothetical protein
MFDRGSFRGRFVSAPMIRWPASRWFRAERTWGALKAGFSGTNMAPSLKRAYVVYTVVSALSYGFACLRRVAVQ